MARGSDDFRMVGGRMQERLMEQQSHRSGVLMNRKGGRLMMPMPPPRLPLFTSSTI